MLSLVHGWPMLVSMSVGASDVQVVLGNDVDETS